MDPQLQRTRNLGRLRAGILVVLGGGALATAGACSLANSFGDVKGSTADSGGGVDTGVLPGDAGDTGFDSNPPIDTGISDTPSETDAPPPANSGLVVVGGEVITTGTTTKNILSVLDPVDGSELSREDLTVSAILYDGERDLWFIAEDDSGNVIPAPGDHMNLHVRSFDRAAKAWKKLGLLTGLPPLQTRDTTVMLRKEIAGIVYLSATSFGLGVINVNDPTAPTVAGGVPIDGSPTTGQGTQPLGAIGTRSTTGTGGTIDLIRRGTCASGLAECPHEMVHITVPNGYVTPLVSSTVKALGAGPSNTNGAVSFGTRLKPSASDLVIFPPSSTITTGTIDLVDPITNSISKSLNFPWSSADHKFLRPAVTAECTAIALTTEVFSSLIYAIPLDKPLDTITLNVGHSGARVVFEPYTSTVLAPFNQGGGFAFTGYTLSADATSPPKLVPAAKWNPPADLQPDVVAVKIPNDFACP